MSVTVKEFGKLENGQTAKLYTMVNKNGTEASFTDLGAAWVTMIVPDRDGWEMNRRFAASLIEPQSAIVTAYFIC